MRLLFTRTEKHPKRIAFGVGMNCGPMADMTKRTTAILSPKDGGKIGSLTRMMFATMAYMESQKAAMQEAITLHLKALTDPEKISAATLSQIATSFGIIVDKATRNTASGNDSLNKLDGLIKEFRDAIKPETD